MAPPPIDQKAIMDRAYASVMQPQRQPAMAGAPTGGGLFDPSSHANTLAELGLSPEEANNVMELYRRGVRAEHL